MGFEKMGWDVNEYFFVIHLIKKLKFKLGGKV